MNRSIALRAAVVAAVLGVGIADIQAVARASPASPIKSTRQVIGDWVVACVPTTAGHKSCVMSQALASKKLQQRVSVFSIGTDQTGKLKGSFRVPVGVALKEGVVVDVENRDPFTVPYAACHRVGCFAPFDLNAPLLGKLKAATKITVVVHSVSQQALQFNFSARGFANAYEVYVAQSK